MKNKTYENYLSENKNLNYIYSAKKNDLIWLKEQIHSKSISKVIKKKLHKIIKLELNNSLKIVRKLISNTKMIIKIQRKSLDLVLERNTK